MLSGSTRCLPTSPSVSTPICWNVTPTVGTCRAQQPRWKTVRSVSRWNCSHQCSLSCRRRRQLRIRRLFCANASVCRPGSRHATPTISLVCGHDAHAACSTPSASLSLATPTTLACRRSTTRRRTHETSPTRTSRRCHRAASYVASGAGRDTYELASLPHLRRRIESMMSQPGYEHAGDDEFLVGDDDFKAATGESIERTLDLSTWHAGVDLGALYQRLEAEVGPALEQERRVQNVVRSDVFPLLRTASDA